MAVIINWDVWERRASPRKNSPGATEVYFAVTCPDCGRDYWLRKCDALKASYCADCQRSYRAAKGFEALVSKHGIEKALKHVAAHCRNNPSWAEVEVMAWLDAAGVAYQREIIQHLRDTDGTYHLYILDFLLPDGTVIEVNGWGHNLQDRRQRDERLARSYQDGRVLWVTTKDLSADAEATRQTLFSAL